MSEPGFQDARTAPNKYWLAPTAETSPFQAPGHDRMFDRHNGWGEDRPNRSFIAKKKHGWWGKEEYYDQNGRKIG
jgi:hypothetical protein